MSYTRQDLLDAIMALETELPKASKIMKSLNASLLKTATEMKNCLDGKEDNDSSDDDFDAFAKMPSSQLKPLDDKLKTILASIDTNTVEKELLERAQKVRKEAEALESQVLNFVLRSLQIVNASPVRITNAEDVIKNPQHYSSKSAAILDISNTRASAYVLPTALSQSLGSNTAQDAEPSRGMSNSN